MTVVSAELAETWGQTLESILERALVNLAALPKPAWESIARGVYELRTETSYQESLLLVDKVIDQLPFSRTAVCIACNRGVLLAADADDSESLIELFEQAIESLRQKPWPLSATALQRRPDGWQEYHPQGEAAVRARNLHTVSLAGIYADQKQALESLHSKTQTDIFVATVGLFRRSQDGNAIRSWCAWGESFASLLPKTDLIAFARAGNNGDDRAMMVRWEHVVSIVSHHMRATSEDPARYFVDATFNDSEWAQLTAAKEG